MLLGEKVAVTPPGAPVTARATAELNPFVPATVSVIDAEAPAASGTPVGFADNVKVGAAIVTADTMVRLNPPPVPVTAIGKVPAAAFAAAVTVIVTGPAVVRLGEEKVTVTPDGAPAADNATGELNPPRALIVRVATFELPGKTERVDELAAIVKFEARLLLQLLTRRKASIEPSPVTMS